MSFLLATAGLFGFAVGSFLTVVVHRLGTGRTVLFGRSQCVHCRRALEWRELVPVFSFLLSGGRCRSCRGPIPRSYPVIELTTAGLFAAAAWGALGRGLPLPVASPPLPEYSGGLLLFLYYAFLAADAVALSAYDIQRHQIPRTLVLPPMLLGAAMQIGGAFAAGTAAPLLRAAAVAAAAFLLFWGLWRASGGRAMGRGDADVALALTLALGPALGLAAVVFSFWIGAVCGILLVMAHYLQWRSRVPFAPFLAAGGIAAVALAGSVVPILIPFAYGF